MCRVSHLRRSIVLDCTPSANPSPKSARCKCAGPTSDAPTGLAFGGCSGRVGMGEDRGTVPAEWRVDRAKWGSRQDFSGGIERLGTGALCDDRPRARVEGGAAGCSRCDSRRFAECGAGRRHYLEKTSRENSSRPKRDLAFSGGAGAWEVLGSHTGGDGGNGGVDRGRCTRDAVFSKSRMESGRRK